MHKALHRQSKCLILHVCPIYEEVCRNPFHQKCPNNRNFGIMVSYGISGVKWVEISALFLNAKIFHTIQRQIFSDRLRNGLIAISGNLKLFF